ncbi:hypothetical protein VM1G_03742 [Cytospora mali]|uniref:DUF1275 domain protein n=1 Tax=Cytospora mali TaxID=578113 RepID=A0A194VYM0_CYTMA|nr:hypothetical protein VM1G_03742 [Valsa mali]
MSKIIENSQHPSPGNSNLDLNENNGGQFRKRWTTPVDLSRANFPLLGCCLVTGLLDTTMFQAYGTFVSMQTGNTIFLGLGASNQNNHAFDWARSLCSIGCFSLGAFFFSRLHRYLRPQPTQRGTLAASFFLQTICIGIAAALIQAGVIADRKNYATNDWTEMAGIAFLSFQAAGQIVSSRVLGVNELPTVVITSLMYLRPQPTQRGTLAASFFLQTICIGIAAALIQAGVIADRKNYATNDWTEMAGIAFLSFQAAGQIVSSRVLGVNELPTVVITSLMCDLWSDPKLFELSNNSKRNNRVAGFVLTLVGSIVGGWMLKGTGTVQPVLWLVCGIKFVIALGWVLWKGQEGPKPEVA